MRTHRLQTSKGYALICKGRIAAVWGIILHNGDQYSDGLVHIREHFKFISYVVQQNWMPGDPIVEITTPAEETTTVGTTPAEETTTARTTTAGTTTARTTNAGTTTSTQPTITDSYSSTVTTVTNPATTEADDDHLLDLPTCLSIWFGVPCNMLVNPSSAAITTHLSVWLFGVMLVAYAC